MIFLELLERELSNITVDAVVQAVIQKKEPDESMDQFALEIEVVERCAKKTTYHVPRWLLEGMMNYFSTVRSDFLSGGEGTKFERSISETDDRAIHTELFFVKSNGKSTFGPSHVVDQHMDSVCNKIILIASIRFKPTMLLTDVNRY